MSFNNKLDKILLKECLDRQNGVCLYCTNAIHCVVKAKSTFSNQIKMFGFCEKHFSETLQINNKPQKI